MKLEKDASFRKHRCMRFAVEIKMSHFCQINNYVERFRICSVLISMAGKFLCFDHIYTHLLQNRIANICLVQGKANCKHIPESTSNDDSTFS